MIVRSPARTLSTYIRLPAKRTRPFIGQLCLSIGCMLTTRGLYSPLKATRWLPSCYQGRFIVTSRPALQAMASPVDALPPTQKCYLDDSYLFALDGVSVLAVLPPSEDNKTPAAVITDRTVFHPQGGGQPSDQGSLVLSSSSSGPPVTFQVSMVKDPGSGLVHHFGTCSDPSTDRGLQAGDKVDMKVDEVRRRLHARLHSAGHAIDVAVAQAGHSHLKATKGYHFADGPYVEYEGAVGDAAAFVRDVNARLAALVQEGIDTQVHMLDKGAAAEMLGGKDSVTHLPDDKDVRVVLVGGQACPCGGTHIRSTSELRPGVEVTKIKAKKNTLRVSYKLLEAQGQPDN